MCRQEERIYKISRLLKGATPKGYIFYEYTPSNLFKKNIGKFFQQVPSFLKANKRLSSDYLTKFRYHFKQSMEPLYLYLNIPFCRQKCPFCHYLTYTQQKYKHFFELYIDALETEMKIISANGFFSKKAVFSALGGGTPFVLSSSQLNRICKAIFRYAADEKTNISFETTPLELLSEAGVDKARIMRDWGIERVSLGVQSFDDKVLKKIGSKHRAVDAHKAITLARNIGFKHINIDCMYGFGFGKNSNGWSDTYQALSRVQAESISLYQLRVHASKAKHFFLGIKSRHAEILEERLSINYGLAKLGYIRYGRHYSRNEEIYKREKPVHDWMIVSGDWLACGVNARSTFGSAGYRNTQKLNTYISCLKRNILPIEFKAEYSLQETSKSFLINSMVGKGGFYKEDFVELYGISCYSVFEKNISVLSKMGLVAATPQKIIIPKRYRLFDLEIINYLCS